MIKEQYDQAMGKLAEENGRHVFYIRELEARLVNTSKMITELEDKVDEVNSRNKNKEETIQCLQKTITNLQNQINTNRNAVYEAEKVSEKYWMELYESVVKERDALKHLVHIYTAVERDEEED